MCIEAAIPGRKRQFPWPAQLLRLLRLLDLHPGMPLDKSNETNTPVTPINDSEPGDAGKHSGQENQIDSPGLEDAGHTFRSVGCARIGLPYKRFLAYWQLNGS
jgi:hypothetical protein